MFSSLRFVLLFVIVIFLKDIAFKVFVKQLLSNLPAENWELAFDLNGLLLIEFNGLCTTCCVFIDGLTYFLFCYDAALRRDRVRSPSLGPHGSE